MGYNVFDPNRGWANGFATAAFALAGRASFASRRFALQSAIALGLSGCSHSPKAAEPTSEACQVCYHTVGMIAEWSRFPEQERAARAALADGFLSRREYDRILAMGDEAEKQVAIAKWSAR